MQQLILLSLFVVAAQACIGMGGGGGGGCCPPPPCPPPASSCGCGGRKKRSIDLPNFTELSATSADELCNSPRLKALLNENISSDLVASKTALASAAESLNEKFVVVCSGSPVSFATAQDTEFCSARRPGVYCDVFSH
ncbi:unnamed protein product, partial [Mesorhabditis spiculigera]